MEEQNGSNSKGLERITKHEQLEAESILQGQATIWKYMFGHVDSMALRCAVELRIADIIHSHNGLITLSQISQNLDSTSPGITCLARIMRLLVHRGIFTGHSQSDGGETLYGLTHSSKWLLHDAELTLAPLLLAQTHPWMTAPWNYLSNCVKENDTIAFMKANGHEIFDFASVNPDFNNIFNDAMACTAKITIKSVISGYKDGFDGIGSLVDVGGGTGSAIAEVVKAYPHVKGINFDMPHVIAMAPIYQGVSHVGGDMFNAIPNADAVFMKWILHDWNDEDCVKILKNCRKAIPEKTGKIIIIDIVLQPDGNGVFDDTGLILDLVMIAHCSGGKERTELEWKKLLQEGGFPRYKIIEIPALQSIIEAYPE